MYPAAIYTFTHVISINLSSQNISCCNNIITNILKLFKIFILVEPKFFCKENKADQSKKKLFSGLHQELTVNIPIYSIPQDTPSTVKWMKENIEITSSSDVMLDRSATHLNCSFYQKTILRPGRAEIMTIKSFKTENEGNYTLEVYRSNKKYHYPFTISLSGLFKYLIKTNVFPLLVPIFLFYIFMVNCLNCASNLVVILFEKLSIDFWFNQILVKKEVAYQRYSLDG